MKRKEWEVSQVDQNNDDSILAADDLEFLRDLFRQNNDYVETLNTIRSEKLTNRTLQRLHYAAMSMRNLIENKTRTQLHLMKEPRQNFAKERKTRMEADVSNYWQPIWNHIDYLETSYRTIIGSLLLTFDVDEEIIKKLASTLEDGYKRGSWKDQIKEEDKEDIKELLVKAGIIADSVGIKYEDVMAEKNRRIEEQDKKIAMLELTEKDRKEIWQEDLLDKAAEKEYGDEWFTYNQGRDLVPMSHTEADGTMKRLVKKGRWAFEKRGKAHYYTHITPSEEENHAEETTPEPEQ